MRTARQLDQLANSRNFGVEPRSACLKRILDAQSAADRQRREAELGRANGRTAKASTLLTPTVRSKVLLPDMFDPLTMSARVSPPAHVIQDAIASLDQRVADRFGLDEGRARCDLRERIQRVFGGVGCERTERLEFADGGEPLDDPGPGAAGQASMRTAICVVQSQRAANGMKSWFLR